ncbi:MAG: COG3014 family protein [bacterium]
MRYLLKRRNLRKIIILGEKNKRLLKTIILFIILPLYSVTAGCAYMGVTSYPKVLQEKKHLLYEGKFNQAVQGSAGKYHVGNSQVLHFMEQGMIYHIEGNYGASISSFEKALSIIHDYEERAVISARDIASQILTLPLNDNALPYKGYPFERVLVNTYQAFNYLLLGDIEKARVEVRRADQRQIKELERHHKEICEYERWGKKRGLSLADDSAFQRVQQQMQEASGSVLNSFQNAFTYYLSGLIYELNGEKGDAYIDYKKTYQLNPRFTCVQKDLLRLSKRLKFQQEYADWVSLFGHTEEDEAVQPSESEAEMIIFYGDGFIPQKQQIKITSHVGGILATIALPVYDQQMIAQDGRHHAIRGLDNGKTLGYPSMVADLNILAVKALREQLPIIFIRQAARILSKTAVTKQAQKGNSGFAFLAASLYSMASENADLRNWLLLPNNLQILRKRISAGAHKFTWLLQSHSGLNLDKQDTSVILQRGDVCLVNLRSIEDRLFCNLSIIHQTK